MRSWRVIAESFLVFAATVLPAVVFAAAAETAHPPNVVLIIADDQHWGDYGFMGHPHLRTPNLDRLARESLVSPRGHVIRSQARLGSLWRSRWLQRPDPSRGIP